jgi:cell pole-organizing protein PopZ
MAEDTEANADPSMEEILASIRKIISDEAPPAEVAAAPAPQEDILELTQMIQEDGSVEDLKPSPAPELPPLSRPAPLESSLISEPVASTAASKLSSLADTVEIERLSSAPMTASFIGNGHRTLEDMVIELMRPLLKDWLDQNLPTIVERLVQKEVERISRRS